MLLLVLLGACTFKSTRPSAPAGTVREPLRAQAEPVPQASAPAVADVPEEPRMPVTEPAIQRPPFIRIEDVVGTSPQLAGAVFAPVTDSMERCAGAGGGFMRVHVSTSGERTRMEIDPTSSAPGEARECVLESLSLLDTGPLEETAASPSDAPPRMDTQLVISW